MSKNEAIQWLGNRGQMMDVSEIIKCKKVGKYLFILFNDNPNEVIQYNLYDTFGECEQGYCLEDFKWTKNHIRTRLTGEFYENR